MRPGEIPVKNKRDPMPIRQSKPLEKLDESDEANVVDLVYEIAEGDRWKVGEIRVNIDGEPHLMRETSDPFNVLRD